MRSPARLPALVQHRRERHPARHRDPPGQQPVEPRPRPRPLHQELGEPGGLHHAYTGPHRQGLGPHPVPGVGTTEGHLLDRLQARRLEPQRRLQAVSVAPHRVGVGETVVDRRSLHAAALGQELVGERDAEPAGVVLPAPWRWCRRGWRGRRSGATSMAHTSKPGSPAVIQLAIARPTPPPCDSPAITPHAVQ